MSALITIMTKAVRKAAGPLLRDFSEVDKLQVSKKGTANFVTNADLRTEAILREELEHARPKFGFLMEESGEVVGTDPEHRWVIDPIDGTTNFIHAIPYFCISLALEKRNSADGNFETIAAMVYDVIHDEIFASEKGQGAVLNNMKMRVSARQKDTLLSTAAPRRYRDNYEIVRNTMEQVTGAGATVRCSGAAALDLAYVAAGRLDGTWYHSLQPWDIAAGLLLVREAGGHVTAIDGSENVMNSSGIIATNSFIHSELQALIHNAA